MNFKSEKFQNIFIIILLVATILIFSIDFIQTKADTNNSIVLKEKKAILDEEIEAYIPPEEVIVEEPTETETETEINTYNNENNDIYYSDDEKWWYNNKQP